MIKTLLQHLNTTNFLYRAQLVLVLHHFDLCKPAQSSQRIINLLDLSGCQDLQRLVQGQCEGCIALRGLLSLSHSAVPFGQEHIHRLLKPKRPTHTPNQACESASGYFSPLSRLSLLVTSAPFAQPQTNRDKDYGSCRGPLVPVLSWRTPQRCLTPFEGICGAVLC